VRQLLFLVRKLLWVVPLLALAGVLAGAAMLVKRLTQGKVHVTLDSWPDVPRNPHSS
jgi:hypothetical protein